MPTDGFRLFRVFGITVYLHWSWVLGFVYFVSRDGSSYGVAAAVSLGLFGIVLLHEFGHALACRSVGGRAERIVLWPLGGVAYVSPPPRPGAVLWSIAAGPLVNVALLPSVALLYYHPITGDFGRVLDRLAAINLGLLLFNLLPLYPLDGGQILQSLLWFALGRSRSLAVSAVIGGLGAVAMGVAAVYTYVTGSEGGVWLATLALFAGSRCWAGWQHAKLLRQQGDGFAGLRQGFDVVLPGRPDFACPSCGHHPPVGAYWACSACRTRLDKFDHPFACPACGQPDQMIPCPDCHARSPYIGWHQPTTDRPLITAQGELVDG